MLGEVTLNSVPSLDTQMTSLRCVPEPQSEEHSAQGPVYQHHVISQGRKLQARMSGGRLPGAQLCSLVPTPASSWPAPRVSPLPRQTTERRWIPVPHSAEHLELQSLWNQATVQGPMLQASLLGGRGGPEAHSRSLTSSPLFPTQRTCRLLWPRPQRTEHCGDEGIQGAGPGFLTSRQLCGFSFFLITLFIVESITYVALWLLNKDLPLIPGSTGTWLCGVGMGPWAQSQIQPLI